MKKVKYIIEIIFSNSHIALIPSAVFFAVSILVYNGVIKYVSEAKISITAEWAIVLGSVMLLTMSGILFIGLFFKVIAGLFRKFFALCGRVLFRKKRQDYKIHGVNTGLIEKSFDDDDID